MNYTISTIIQLVSDALCDCLIGASLSKPHTNGKVICQYPFIIIYDQMRKFVCHRPLHATKAKLTSSLVPHKDVMICKECLSSSIS